MEMYSIPRLTVGCPVLLGKCSSHRGSGTHGCGGRTCRSPRRSNYFGGSTLRYSVNLRVYLNLCPAVFLPSPFVRVCHRAMMRVSVVFAALALMLCTEAARMPAMSEHDISVAIRPSSLPQTASTADHDHVHATMETDDE